MRVIRTAVCKMESGWKMDIGEEQRRHGIGRKISSWIAWLFPNSGTDMSIYNNR